MRATLRPLSPGEPEAELLVLGASSGALAWGGAWLAAGLPVPPCAFHTITGCPCPTCGATRCVLALLHGRVAEAIGWNPLMFAGIAGLVALNVYAAGVLAARLPRVRLTLTGMEGRIVRMGFVVLLAANWGYEIHRGV